MADTDDDALEHAENHEESGGDYSYDLVHGEVPVATRGPALRRPVAPADEAIPATSGDYSYDLAHEIPPPGS